MRMPGYGDRETWGGRSPELCTAPPEPERCEFCDRPLPTDCYGNTEALLIRSPAREHRVCPSCYIQDPIDNPGEYA